MIRILYSDKSEGQYKNPIAAQFMVWTKIFDSQGTVVPIQAAEVFGTTTGGVVVEMEFPIISSGAIDFNAIQNC